MQYSNEFNYCTSNVCTKISHQRGRDCDYDKHDISVISCDTDIKERITRDCWVIQQVFSEHFQSLDGLFSEYFFMQGANRNFL